MASNINQFLAGLRAFYYQRVPSAFTRRQAKIGIEIADRIIDLTPVESGRARGEWQGGVGAPATGLTGTVDPTGRQALGKIAATFNAYAGSRVPTTLHITNNVPYAQQLEKGSSDQAPAGMVAVATSERRALRS